MDKAHDILTEIVTKPVNLVLAGICIFLLKKLLTPLPSHSTSTATAASTAAAATKMQQGQPQQPRENVPLSELLVHDGTNGSDIWLCVNGKIFNVTRGRNFYGPGGPYASFAGRDATRGLAKMDTAAVTRTVADTSDLTQDELNTAKQWEDSFAAKYEFIGTLAQQ